MLRSYTRPGNSRSCHFTQDQLVSLRFDVCESNKGEMKIKFEETTCEWLHLWRTDRGVCDYWSVRPLSPASAAWVNEKKWRFFLKQWTHLVSIKPLGKQFPFCSWFFSKAAYMKRNQGSVTFPVTTSRARKRQNELNWKHMAVTICSSEDTGWDLGFDSSFSMPPCGGKWDEENG